MPLASPHAPEHPSLLVPSALSSPGPPCRVAAPCPQPPATHTHASTSRGTLSSPAWCAEPRAPAMLFVSDPMQHFAASVGAPPGSFGRLGCLCLSFSGALVGFRLVEGSLGILLPVRSSWSGTCCQMGCRHPGGAEAGGEVPPILEMPWGQVPTSAAEPVARKRRVGWVSGQLVAQPRNVGFAMLPSFGLSKLRVCRAASAQLCPTAGAQRPWRSSFAPGTRAVRLPPPAPRSRASSPGTLVLLAAVTGCFPAG